METFSALLAICMGISLVSGEFTKASNAELWCFLWPVPEQTAEEAIETPVVRDAIGLIITVVRFMDLTDDKSTIGESAPCLNYSEIHNWRIPSYWGT